MDNGCAVLDSTAVDVSATPVQEQWVIKSLENCFRRLMNGSQDSNLLFLRDIEVSKQCIIRLLFIHRWSRKVCKRRALEARSDLRAAYMATASRYSTTWRIWCS